MSANKKMLSVKNIELYKEFHDYYVDKVQQDFEQRLVNGNAIMKHIMQNIESNSKFDEYNVFPTQKIIMFKKGE